MKRILVINPNSTQEMTFSLRDEIATLSLPDTISVDYHTGPISIAPPSINNQEDAKQSTVACLQEFDDLHPHIYSSYDGYLVACYSDHPLVEKLQERVKPGAVVMGIFQASMLYALNYTSSSCKAAILTSGKDWEILLDLAIVKFLDSGDNNFPNSKFCPTLAAGVPVLDLHKDENYPLLHGKIQQLVSKDVRIVLLGCAGLSPLNDKMKADFPMVKFVDSVKIGVRLLIAYIEVGNI